VNSDLFDTEPNCSSTLSQWNLRIMDTLGAGLYCIGRFSLLRLKCIRTIGTSKFLYWEVSVLLYSGQNMDPPWLAVGWVLASGDTTHTKSSSLKVLSDGVYKKARHRGHVGILFTSYTNCWWLSHVNMCRDNNHCVLWKTINLVFLTQHALATLLVVYQQHQESISLVGG